MGYKRHIFYQPECDYPDFDVLPAPKGRGTLTAKRWETSASRIRRTIHRMVP